MNGIHVVFINNIQSLNIVPKWKKGEKEFKVSITYHKHRGCQNYLPKPIVEMLGNPKSIRFIIENKRIGVESGD